MDEFHIDKAIACEAPTTLWREYYEKQSGSKACNTKVILGSYAKVIEKKENWQPGNVRYFHQPSQGVWHPDRLLPVLYWGGGRFVLDGRSAYFNPFVKIPDDVLMRKFTEQLPAADQVRRTCWLSNPAHA